MIWMPGQGNNKKGKLFLFARVISKSGKSILILVDALSTKESLISNGFLPFPLSFSLEYECFRRLKENGSVNKSKEISCAVTVVLVLLRVLC